MYAKIYEKKGVVLLSSCFRLLVILSHTGILAPMYISNISPFMRTSEDKAMAAYYWRIFEKKGVVLLSSCFRLLVILNKVLIEETIGALIFIS